MFTYLTVMQFIILPVVGKSKKWRNTEYSCRLVYVAVKKIYICTFRRPGDPAVESGFFEERLKKFEEDNRGQHRYVTCKSYQWSYSVIREITSTCKLVIRNSNN